MPSFRGVEGGGGWGVGGGGVDEDKDDLRRAVEGGEAKIIEFGARGHV